MATAMAPRPMTAEEKKVIFASSLGTVFEWYPIIVAGIAFVIGMLFIKETRSVDIYAND